jgi:hypothetical protein
MDRQEYLRAKTHLEVLREIAQTYRGRTIENVIDNLEARLKHYESLV